MTFSLPKLEYKFNHLEPHIDQQTMQIHYEKHHGGYVNNLNKAIQQYNTQTPNIESILKNTSKYNQTIRNNAGGHYNHTLFWSILTPNKTKISKTLLKAINEHFTSFDKFKSQFSQSALQHFGSGWTWLCINNNKLFITSTPNQDNPIMDIAQKQGQPILALDVWEHAYYLKYQNKRIEYIEAFWNIINWQEVSNKLEQITK